MMRALSTAATGGKAMMDRIDTISNNLANVSTTGYKKTRAEFADLLYQQIQRAGFGEAGRNQNTTGQYFGTGVKLVGTSKSFTQGTLQRTEQDLDIAIEGEGFLRVLLPDQTTAFTRAGNFALDSQGNLVTKDGLLLDPPITVSQNITKIFINQDGLVQGLDPQTPDSPTSLGQLELTRFINPAGLEAIGDNLYRVTAAAGDQIQGQPGAGQGFGIIRQGFLEQSNVDVVQELIEMISAQRAFEMNSKSIETADEILQTVSNLRR